MSKISQKPTKYSIGSRIEMIISHFDISLNKFSKRIHLSPGYVSEIKKGLKPANERFIYLISITFDVNEDWLRTGKGEMFKTHPIPEAQMPILIAVLGKCPAGFPETPPQLSEIVDYIGVVGVPQNAYAVLVKGDSMSPEIRDGDYVLFMPHADIKDGDVVIACNEFQEPIIKRYRVQNGAVWLFSDNPEYPSLKVNEHYRIIGKAFQAVRTKKL